jgi:hypothetical protein
VSEVLPQSFKPRRIARRVNDGVLNVPVSEVVLNEPRVCHLIRKGKAASVAQHVGLGRQGQLGQLAIAADRKPCRNTAQGASVLTHEESVCLRFIFARSASQALMALTSSDWIGCVVESPPSDNRRSRCRIRAALVQPHHVV